MVVDRCLAQTQRRNPPAARGHKFRFMAGLVVDVYKLCTVCFVGLFKWKCRALQTGTSTSRRVFAFCGTQWVVRIKGVGGST